MKNMKKSKKIVSLLLFAVCAALLVSSVAGYVTRGSAATAENLDTMRTQAVLHAASGGLVETFASRAQSEKLMELRKLPNFRKLGTPEVTRQCEEAAEQARQEAKALYSNVEGIDTSALEAEIKIFEQTVSVYNEAENLEKDAYAEFYNALIDSVTDWEEFVSGKDDAAILASVLEQAPELPAQLHEGFVQLAKDMEKAAAEAAAKADAATEETTTEETADEVTVDYKYFTPGEELNALDAQVEEKYGALWTVLVEAIPDLSGLDEKITVSVRESIVDILSTTNEGFAARYKAYHAQEAETVLQGKAASSMKLAANAETVLIGGVALLLLTCVYAFWDFLTGKMGVPRTIILLFFVYLCLAGRLFEMNMSMLFGNVLERFGMYGILALAMLPGIQCGIGLNMGMTIGCVAGLFGIITALQYNMTGYTALLVSMLVGTLVAVPMGWAYSLLLNRMKGSEMTVSTYVGYSFVSLMCIGWMILPYNNPRIVFPLRGSGMRVTHGLIGVFAHLLDNLGAFRLFGVKVPTGLLLTVLLFCGIMWLFSRSKVGIAMSAVGSNPRFAEASGINVDRMRTLGTTLSTVLAAIGIIIYSSAFGYAQLYTAPKQMGFIAASAILIGGATTGKAKVNHVLFGVFLFEGVLTLGQQIANAAISGGGLSEVMRILISNGIILYALTQSGGDSE